ncbi:signal peptidase I [Isoptericola sp. NPDC060257]|uniref:signal peptidase I n=1 Tax=Isoptericola sp. NPDC060257 TaxID=3347087 RepID=UPI003649FA10
MTAGTGQAPATDVTSSPARRPRTTGRPRRILGRVASVALGAVMVALLALAGAAVVVPKAMGATPLTVLTGSMEPSLSPGDVVVVRPVDPADVQVGDVLTFQPVSGDPTLVTHRVVGLVWGGDGEPAGFTTRGDANGADDDPIVADQVQGRVLYSIPAVGHLTNASWAPTAVKVAAVGLILYGVVAVVTPDRSRRSRRRTEPTTDRDQGAS